MYIEVIIKWLWDNRTNPFTIAALLSLAYTLLEKFGRKLITNQLKRLFHVKDKSAFSTYVENQKRIESKVDMLIKERGLTWSASEIVYTESTGKRLLTSSQLGRLNALFARKSTMRGKHKMKSYLKKLGSRKFQAFLAVTIPNMIIMFGFILGDIDLEGQVNQWMPAINLVIQAITTATYQQAEGKVDAANAVKIGDSGPAE